jgi:hypothetical protein
MSNKTDPFSAMLVRLFAPLVRLLLRFGVPYKAAAEALKWVYVDIATREFALAAQTQTKSRVAVITGMTRLEVERLQREPPRPTDTTVRMFHRAARVLNGWKFDATYQDQEGQPKLLSFDIGSHNFQTLVSEYAGGTTARAVLDELKRGGNVSQLADGSLRLDSLELLVSNEDQNEQLAILATATSDLIGTIERNLRAGQTDRYLQAYVHQLDVPQDQVTKVRAFVRQRANALLDETDRLLADLQRNANPNDAQTRCERLGLGIYYFQKEPDAPPPKHDTRGRRSQRNSADAKVAEASETDSLATDSPSTKSMIAKSQVAKSQVAKSQVAKSQVAKSQVAKSQVAKMRTPKP